MKLKTDENLPQQAAQILREAGYDADSVLDEGLSGAADPNLIRQIQPENRTLVTLDLDFSNLLAYPPENYAGIIVMRAKSQEILTVLRLIEKFIPLLNTQFATCHGSVISCQTGLSIS